MIIDSAQRDCVLLGQAAVDFNSREIQYADLNRCADELVTDDAIDEVASLGVEGLARDTEHVGPLRDSHGNDDIGVGQEVAASVIDGDDALADVARTVSDDGG